MKSSENSKKDSRLVISLFIDSILSAFKTLKPNSLYLALSPCPRLFPIFLSESMRAKTSSQDTSGSSADL